MITEKAFAKVNLTLNITGKRSDGYHTLESVMQTVSLCDSVFLEKAADITVSCSELSGENNIAYKASKHFFEFVGIKGGVKINIDKRIPICAGFGGGSADAAAVLRGLNRLYGCGLTPDSLRSIALKIGADVPFLIEGGTCLCTGIGEVLEKLPCNTHIYYCLCRGVNGASTKAMFDEIDDRPLVGKNSNEMLKALKSGDIERISALTYNDFDSVCCDICPECEGIKKALIDAGALTSSLSGSGTGVFGIFENESKAKYAAEKLKARIFAEPCIY